jgi:quercetin dioxygenase-like cupin family protein
MSGIRLERWTADDGPLTEKRLRAAMEREGYEVAVFTYREATVFPDHAHGQDKCDAVLEGVLRVIADGVAYDLESGDRLYLPAGTRHTAQVLGRRTVLSLDGSIW